MKLKLFKIVVEGRDPVFLLGRTSHRASFAFIVHELNAGRSSPTFTAERIDHKLPADQRVGLDELLVQGSPGVMVVCDPLFGWGAVDAN